MNLNKLLLTVSLFISFVSAQDCKSELIIKSDFSLVNIFINDSLVSENGQFIGEIPNGTFIIIADENSDRWNSKTFIDTLIISDCKKIELNYIFRADTISGNQIQSFDGFDFQKKYYLSDAAYQQTDLIIPNPLKKEKFVDSNLFRILTGTAIILGGITAYYKIKADKYFDDYLSTLDQEKLDKTKTYDLVSGITLTAFQINFSYILVRFLLE